MKGVLIFAFNNDYIDYFNLAVGCAKRVTKYLDLPVTIVTDVVSQGNRTCAFDIVLGKPETGGGRVFNPGVRDDRHPWLNASRYQAWTLSPYEQTMVLDSDYVVSSDRLLSVFQSNLDVTCVKHVYDPTDCDLFKPYDYISEPHGLHHWWATVLYFNRSQRAQDFFELMTMIRANYQHYANIYGFHTAPFRNDFSASIALNTVYGHVPEEIPSFPWRMANVASEVGVDLLEHDLFQLRYNDKKQQPKRSLIGQQDFHCMNKIALSRIYESTS